MTCLLWFAGEGCAASEHQQTAGEGAEARRPGGEIGWVQGSHFSHSGSPCHLNVHMCFSFSSSPPIHTYIRTHYIRMYISMYIPYNRKFLQGLKLRVSFMILNENHKFLLQTFPAVWYLSPHAVYFCRPVCLRHILPCLSPPLPSPPFPSPPFPPLPFPPLPSPPLPSTLLLHLPLLNVCIYVTL